jgi:cold-inducible RNA-binding protein
VNDRSVRWSGFHTFWISRLFAFPSEGGSADVEQGSAATGAALFFEVRLFDGLDQSRGRESAMGNRLYVGNLSFNTDEDTLRDAFSRVGETSEVKVVMDRETGRSRGFAFVTMNDSNAAQKAIAELDGRVLDGRPLRVNEAEERNAGGGGGRGGMGGGGGRGGMGGGGGGGGSRRW